MKFWKENSYEIVRLFVIQIGITIFSFIVSAAALALSEQNFPHLKPYVYLGVGIFATAFQLFIVYTAMWEVGSKKRESIERGRFTASPVHGLKIALWSNTVNFALLFITAVGLLRYAVENSFVIGMHGISRAIYIFLNSMHTGILRFFAPSENSYLLVLIVSLLLLVPQIVVSTVAYTFGTKGLRVTKAKPPSIE